jgi:ubiquinone/menaquinone biosynthesis C-methylase UbiE
MTGLSGSNPMGRFTGLAKQYARYRPDYPAAALDFIMARGRLGPGALLVDVGCGTGISARLFAERGVPVLGIEPNADMRARAQEEPVPPGVPVPDYVDGRAEAMNLPDSIADVVLAAQAFHWFDPAAALREFHRILKPSGWAVLMWNEPDESDSFTAAYVAVVRTAPDAAAVEVPCGRAGEPLLTSLLFTDTERLRFPHQQTLKEEELLGRAFSASYAPREPGAAAAHASDLRAIFARFQEAGRVVLRYETSAYVGRRKNA